MKVTGNKNRFSRILTVDDVDDVTSLCLYLNQTTGTPLPLAKENAKVNKAIKDYFDNNEGATFKSLTDLARWARANNKHLDMFQLLMCWKTAFQGGYMAILQRGGSNDDETLSEMLKSVDDEHTRERMVGAGSARVRDEIYREYVETEAHTDPEPVIDYPLLDSYGLAPGATVKVKSSFAAPPEYAVVLGETDDKIRVRVAGQEMDLLPRLVEIRKGREWERLS